MTDPPHPLLPSPDDPLAIYAWNWSVEGHPHSEGRFTFHEQPVGLLDSLTGSALLTGFVRYRSRMPRAGEEEVREHDRWVDARHYHGLLQREGDQWPPFMTVQYIYTVGSTLVFETGYTGSEALPVEEQTLLLLRLLEEPGLTLRSWSITGEAGAGMAQGTTAEDLREHIAGAFIVTPYLRRPDQLCGMILQRTPAAPPYGYRYRERILVGAGVDPDQDGPEEIRRKVQALWELYEKQLVCTDPAADGREISLITLALVCRFDPLIEDVLEWGVELNRVDGGSRTPLDHLRQLVEQHTGTPEGETSGAYYERLRAAGARHAHEL